MEKYEIEKIIEKKYEILSNSIETLFTIISEISGTMNAIRDLNYINKRNIK